MDRRIQESVPGLPPLLTVPTMSEELIVYLFISSTVVSAVLIREENKIHKPVYYISKVLMDAETRYLKIGKLAYAFLIITGKLHHYFQAYPIVVLIDQPLKQILQQPDTSGRLLKLSIELSEFHINYRPRMEIIAQALADFIAEFTHDVVLEPKVVLLEKEAPEEQNPVVAQDLFSKLHQENRWNTPFVLGSKPPPTKLNTRLSSPDLEWQQRWG